MASKNFFGVFFTVLTFAVAGCDAVSGLFGGGKTVVRREPKAERALGSTPTPGPTATPRRTPAPDPGPSRSGNATTPVPDPGVIDAPVEAPVVTPTPWYPWLTANGTDLGNGLTSWEIRSGGFGHKKPWGHWTYPKDRPVDDQTVVAVTAVDEVVYWLVYRYQLGGQYGGWCCNGTYDDDSKVDGDAFLWGERAIFRLEAIHAGAASFSLVATQSTGEGKSLEHEMGFIRGERRLKWANPRERALVFLVTWAVLPATPSEDVLAINTDSIRLSDQAAGRWGSDRIPIILGPLYVQGWFLDWWKVTNQYTEIDWARSSLINSHAVGREAALVARKYYNVENKYESSSWLQHYLFRLNKGEAGWRSLRTFPMLGNWAPYHDLVWTSLYGEPMFFIREGGFAGTVYSVSEQDAMKLP